MVDQTTQVECTAAMQKTGEETKFLPLFHRMMQRDADRHIGWHGDLRIISPLKLVLEFRGGIVAGDQISADVLVEDL